MNSLKHLAAICLMATVSACGGGGGDPAPVPAPAPAPAPTPFASVDAAANAAFVAQGISGMGLSIYNAQGTKVFEKMYGSFSADQRVAIASASKLVAGLTIMRLITQGYLSLDSTTGTVLGWTGTQGTITLRQLLSFTSGLDREHPCTLLPNLTLAECVALIGAQPLVAPPGTRYDYGSSHLHVAARMAEVVTGAAWNDLFNTQLKTPLAIGAEAVFYTAPRQGTGTGNPLIAGGLRATMNEYAKLLALDFNRGVHQGTPLITAALFDAQGTEPYPNAVIGLSPFASHGYPFHYGLAAWTECTPPAVNCQVISSPGAFGFTPWLDRDGGYYAILGMEVAESQSGVVAFAVALEQQLKPLIRSALQ
jgi:D-alanyl-D-alanine-carboxypeptidase/D-alanyl-D-alanine-endopeptidase